MHIQVDLDRCEGHGLCVLASPEVFDLDEDGRLHYDAAPSEEHRAEVEDAAANCPVGAIKLVYSAPPGGPSPDSVASGAAE